MRMQSTKSKDVSLKRFKLSFTTFSFSIEINSSSFNSSLEISVREYHSKEIELLHLHQVI